MGLRFSTARNAQVGRPEASIEAEVTSPRNIPRRMALQLSTRNNAMFNGIASELGSCAQPKFTDDRCSMELDSFRRDSQDPRNLFCRFAFGNQLKHFTLASS